MKYRTRNLSLNHAKQNQDDEYYTLLDDIENEISSHKDYVRHFKDKIILCNCDDPEWSAFVEFFKLHFNQLQIKKMIATHFNKDGNPSYKLEWIRNSSDEIQMVKTPLKCDGSFQSDECVELLKESDIVVTNPPFSIAREEFIPLLFKHNKDFVIIGDIGWSTYNKVFPFIKNKKMFFGYNSVKYFKRPDGTLKQFGNKLWFTTLNLDKTHEPMPLTANYKGNESKYPSYDNYDAIECSKVKSIPKDYYGVIGVPPSFLSNYCSEQFEIIGTVGTKKSNNTLNLCKDYSKYIGYYQDGTKNGRTGSTFGKCPVIIKDDKVHPYYEKDGIRVQAISPRIFIKRIDTNEQDAG